jgi:hypothetical protein
MCGEIGARVARSRPHLVGVRIVTERYDVVSALRAARPTAVARHVRAECLTPA